MASLNGFKIIQIAFDKTVESPHLMYFKKHTHQKQNDLTPTDKTIFIVNVPPYCTRKGLQNVFGSHGPIKSIFLQDAPGPVLDRSDEKLMDIFKNEVYQFKVPRKSVLSLWHNVENSIQSPDFEILARVLTVLTKQILIVN